jgi:hypothetical protein
VLSFYAPYFCEREKVGFQALIDAYIHREAITSRTPPPTMKCPTCGADARYDGTVEAFASAAEKIDPSTPAPPPGRRAVDPDGPTLKRQVKGRTTRLELAGELTTGVRWRTAMDNLDGELVVDLTQSHKISQGAISPLVTALRTASADAVLVLGCPLPLAEALRGAPIQALRIGSIQVEGKCRKCGVLRRATVELEQGTWEEALTRTAACPKCGTPLDVGQGTEAVPHRTLPFGWLLGLSAGLAGVGFLVVLTGFVLAGVGRWTGASDDMPGTGPGDDRLQMADDQVSATGHGGPYATAAEAEAAASDKALGMLVSAMAREIATKRGLSTGAVDVRPADVARFLAAVSLDAASLKLDAQVVEGGGGFEVDARYGLPREKFDAIVAEYAEEKDWGGLRLVRPFPPAPGLRVVKSEIAGVEPGARIVQIAHGEISTLAELPPPTSGTTFGVQEPDGTEREVTLP